LNQFLHYQYNKKERRNARVRIARRKDLREKAINRIEVLDKVKKLFLIPEMDVMTLPQVANYYEVEPHTLTMLYQRNKEEINLDGTMLKSYKDFLISQDVTLETKQGKSIIKLSDTITLEIPNRGIRCFSKRAILRIGMLLRDSDIAKEVRTQLLNTFEHSTDKQKTADIDDETKLIEEVGRMYCLGDKESFAIAAQSYIAFQNRHIKKLKDSNEELENNNKALAGELLKWDDRKCINRAVRLIASECNTKFGYIWKELYDELRYKHGIGLSQRGKPPFIQYVKKDEWAQVQQSLAAICETRGVSFSKIIKTARLSVNE